MADSAVPIAHELAAGSTLTDATYWSLVVYVWGPLVLAAPALAFPLAMPWLTVICLSAAVVWLVLADLRGGNPARTLKILDSPLGLPLIALFSLALIGSWRSDSLWVTLPKLAGLALGLWTLSRILVTGTSASRIWFLGLAYLAFGLVTILVATLSGPQWKWDFYAMYSAIPRVFTIPSAENGVNPNALGGTTLFFLPVAVALAWRWRMPRDTQSVSLWRRVGLDILERGLYGLSALPLFAVLWVSGSRAAWVSSAVSILLVLSLRSRVIAILGAIAGVTACVGAWWKGPAETLTYLTSRYPSAIGSLVDDDRTLIWRFAIRAIGDHPWIGVGLGAFRDVVRTITVDGVFYPTPIVHAHNMFLAVALDVGLPGLLAYLAVLAIVSFMTWHIIRCGKDARLRSLCLGLWGALFATHLFGLTDAIALGAKVGLFFWCAIGLIAASYGVVVAEERAERSRDSEGTRRRTLC